MALERHGDCLHFALIKYLASRVKHRWQCNHLSLINVLDFLPLLPLLTPNMSHVGGTRDEMTGSSSDDWIY
jgi:hypothetical protein